MRIDWDMYGLLVRVYRKKKGNRKADEFAAYMNEKYGAKPKLTRESVYKIEKARQMPSAEQFFALNLELFGTLLPERVLEFAFEQGAEDASND